MASKEFPNLASLSDVLEDVAVEPSTPFKHTEPLTVPAAPVKSSRSADADELESCKKEIAALKAELAAAKAVCAVLDTETPLGMLQSIGSALWSHETRDDPWKGKHMEVINRLKPDSSGKVGEKLLVAYCKSAAVSCVYSEDKNSTDGTYDMLIAGKKVEVKTARLGRQGGFQHETLKTDGYDYMAFVDIVPDAVFLTILPRFDMKIRNPVFGRTPHLRKGTHDVFKFDYGLMNLASAVKNGATLHIDSTTCLRTVCEYIKRVIL